MDNQLKCAFYQFRTWCTEEGHSPNIRRFGGLKPKPAEFPELNCKASDVPILLRWLIAILQPRGPCSDWQLMACAAAWNADALFTILAKADAFLSPQEACAAATFCGDFLAALAWLARDAVDAGRLLYNIRPKFHLLLHVRDQLHSADAQLHTVLNPMLHSTWQDESFVGRVSRIARRVHASNGTASTLQRYLCVLRVRWSRASSPGPALLRGDREPEGLHGAEPVRLR